MYKGFNRGRFIDCCKDCRERFEACHDRCERYKSAKAEWDNRREKIKAEKRKAIAIDDYQISAIQQMKKGKR